MMHQKVARFIRSEFNHYLLTMAEQRKYELEREVNSLQKAYGETQSNYIWEMLEEARRQLTNVSARLAHYRMKNY